MNQLLALLKNKETEFGLLIVPIIIFIYLFVKNKNKNKNKTEPVVAHQKPISTHHENSFSVRPPIVIIGDGGTDIFLTKESAECYVELVDVQDGDYVKAYDADAQPLEIKIIDDQVKVCKLNQLSNTNELEQVLIDFLLIIPQSKIEYQPAEIKNMKLNELLQIVIRYATF